MDGCTVSRGIPAVSKKQMDDAAADARFLMANSPSLPSYVTLDIVSRQLFLLARDAISQNIEAEWEVSRPDLIMDILGMSAQERSVATKVDPHELREALLYTVLPVVDVLCRMAEDEQSRKAVFRGGTSETSNVGELSGDATSAGELQGSGEDQGIRGEEENGTG